MRWQAADLSDDAYLTAITHYRNETQFAKLNVKIEIAKANFQDLAIVARQNLLCVSKLLNRKCFVFG